jgi:hypothetical protein
MFTVFSPKEAGWNTVLNKIQTKVTYSSVFWVITRRKMVHLTSSNNPEDGRIHYNCDGRDEQIEVGKCLLSFLAESFVSSLLSKNVKIKITEL